MIPLDPQGFGAPGDLGVAIAYAVALAVSLGVVVWLGRTASTARQPR